MEHNWPVDRLAAAPGGTCSAGLLVREGGHTRERGSLRALSSPLARWQVTLRQLELVACGRDLFGQLSERAAYLARVIDQGQASSLVAL